MTIDAGSHTAHAAGAVVNVRAGDVRGDVHAAFLIDVGGGRLEPVLTLCEEMADPAPVAGEVNCLVCQVRLPRPSPTERRVRGAARRVLEGRRRFRARR
ncbi:MAG: hypothetical protein GEV11_19090 [Streptosporangiales bacterium]|nr:hypothetical protein [Streptosporangiales bacterium]